MGEALGVGWNPGSWIEPYELVSDGRKAGQTEGRPNGRKEGRTDGRSDRRTEGRTDYIPWDSPWGIKIKGFGKPEHEDVAWVSGDLRHAGSPR